MIAKAFIDTNIFIYTQRTDCPEKKRIAENAVAYFDCAASTQVLNEICNVFTKKYPVPIEKVELLVKSIRQTAEIIVVSEELILHALQLHKQYGSSYFDSLMIAAALYARCGYLISEDMRDGLIIDKKLKIVNVFIHPDIIPEVKYDP